MIDIKKEGNLIALEGNLRLVERFIRNNSLVQKVKDSRVLTNENMKVKYWLHDTSNDLIVELYIDFLDDILFNLLSNYNIAFNNNIDFSTIEHSEIINESRYELLEVLNKFKPQFIEAEVVSFTPYKDEELIVCEVVSDNETNVLIADTIDLMDKPCIGDKLYGFIDDGMFIAQKTKEEGK